MASFPEWLSGHSLQPSLHAAGWQQFISVSGTDNGGRKSQQIPKKLHVKQFLSYNPRERQSECSHGKTASSEDTTVVQCDLESSLPLKSPVRDADIVPNEARRTVPRPLSQASVITHDSSIAYYANEFDSPPSAFVGRRFSTASTVSLAGARRTSIELSLPPSPRETSPFSPTSPRAGVFAYMQQNARSPLGSSNTISFASQHRLQREPSANSARHILPSRASSFNSHRSGRISGGSLPRLNTPMGRRSGIIDEIPPLPKSPRFPSPI
ncbi:hypothetical protein BDQ17DRAFT_1425300 [Cyathus striatus]|nr:hypothetical protein BDQ17DRAFT_1425300 [Cyathus striatus]